MKLQEIIYEKECYVYSNSYRFCISQFAFALSTTIGPLDGDFTRAVNITWKRKDRNLLSAFRKTDNLVFQVALGFGLSDKLQDSFVNKVFHGTAGSIREVSKVPHHSLIELV